MGKPFKIFGIGLNKTGTTTLKLALRRLGYDHSKRQTPLARAWLEGDLAPIWAEADAHESFEDWPWPLLYRELWDRYGDRARYILTTRSSAERWVESLKKHSERTSGVMIRQGIFGYKFPHGVEAEHAAFYERHNAEVRSFFADKPDVYTELNWEAGDGWLELCRFLQVPVPNRDFPHGNAGRDANPDPEQVEQNRIKIRRHLRKLKAD